jgi:hypothetical protein
MRTYFSFGSFKLDAAGGQLGRMTLNSFIDPSAE